jgi:hypothetical protein
MSINEKRKLIAEAEKMIERHGRAEFLSWDRPKKEKKIERVARQLEINLEKFRYLLEMGQSLDEVKEKARQETMADCPDVFQTKLSVNLAKQLNEDEEP